jgi:membrane-bound lytic murein transglycosylase D
MRQSRFFSLLILFTFLFDTGCSLIPQRTPQAPAKNATIEEPINPGPQKTQKPQEDYFADKFIYPADLDVAPYASMDADTLRKLLWLRDRQIDIYSQSVDSLFFQVDSLNSELADAYSRVDVNPDFVIPDTVTFAGHLFDLRNERYRDKFASTIKTELRLANVWIPRSGKYFAVFDSIVAKSRVPKDVKYLAVAESSLNSMANSWAGAGGIWQFMPSTGKLYKLTINDYIDERRNIFLATAAATRYLEDAYDLLASKGAPDWLLAFCAYNAGAGRITQVINEQGGKDFFNLIQRVDETNQYVWRSLAIKVIFQNEEAIFGHKLDREKPLMEQCKLVELNLRSSQNINEWAKAQGTTISKVWELNPWIKMHKTSRGKRLTPLNDIVLGPGDYKVLVPRESIADPIRLAQVERGFLERRATVSRDDSGSSSGGYEYYIVRKNDSLGKIAAKYGLTPQALKNLNGLKTNRVKVGQKLRVRVIPGDTEEARPDSLNDSPKVAPKAVKPDSLLKQKAIAESTKAVSKPDSQQVKVPVVPDNTSTYVVQRGDNLGKIASRHGLTVNELLKLNGLNSTNINVGQKIKVSGTPEEKDSKAIEKPVNKTSDKAAKATKAVTTKKTDAKSGTYTVKRGDNLSAIAKKLNVTVDHLTEMNNITAKTTITVGMKLKY